MKFLIIGLGSMGKRRIRNLQTLKQSDISGFDTNQERCKEVMEKYGCKTFSDLNIALNEKPDAMIISTPPDLHIKYAKLAIENKINFFTEASVIKDGMEELIQSLTNSGIIGVPSSTLRYHPIVNKISNILELNKVGKPLAFLYHSGQYLPDWHPWEDYRKFYVSKKEIGACKEIVPFELVWLTKMFGKIDKVMADKSKISNLETEIDDIYNILLKFKNGIKGNLTIDVIARFPYRQLKILAENGVIFADWIDRKVMVFTGDEGWIEEKIYDGKVEKNYIHGEEMYVNEMEEFLKTIEKKITQPYTFEDDFKILTILEQIDSSSDLGKQQTINN